MIYGKSSIYLLLLFFLYKIYISNNVKGLILILPFFIVRCRCQPVVAPLVGLPFESL